MDLSVFLALRPVDACGSDHLSALFQNEQLACSEGGYNRVPGRVDPTHPAHGRESCLLASMDPFVNITHGLYVGGGGTANHVLSPFLNAYYNTAAKKFQFIATNRPFVRFH